MSLKSNLTLLAKKCALNLPYCGRGGQDEIKGEKPLASPVDLRDVERHRRGGASQAGRGELREKVIVKKKVVPKTTSPKNR